MFNVEAYFDEWERAYRAERKLAKAEAKIAKLELRAERKLAEAEAKIAKLELDLAATKAQHHGNSWPLMIVRQLRHSARFARASGITCDSFIIGWADQHGRTPRAVYFQLERMGLVHGGPPQ